MWHLTRLFVFLLLAALGLFGQSPPTTLKDRFLDSGEPGLEAGTPATNAHGFSGPRRGSVDAARE